MAKAGDVARTEISAVDAQPAHTSSAPWRATSVGAAVAVGPAAKRAVPMAEPITVAARRGGPASQHHKINPGDTIKLVFCEFIGTTEV